MKNQKSKIKNQKSARRFNLPKLTNIWTIFYLLFAAVIAAPALAQIPKANIPPQIYLSFSTDTYAPVEYLSKVRSLPAPGSNLTLTADLFTIDAKGNFSRIDPAKYNFQWIFMNRFEDEGLGLNKITVKVPRTPAREVEATLILTLPKQTKELTRQVINIPLASPQVLFSKIENGKQSGYTGTRFQLSKRGGAGIFAQPYFFTVQFPSELSYEWKYKDQVIAPGEGADPRILLLNFPKEYPAGGEERFSLTVRNPAITAIGIREQALGEIMIDVVE